MPLPPGLLAKLKNRGIVVQAGGEDDSKKSAKPSGQQTEEVEEVFAEDYDNEDVPADALLAPKPKTKPQPVAPTEPNLLRKVADCPNAWNSYHECVDYCKKRWGCKKFKPDPVMLKRRNRMLRKYPLPQDWYEVADPETNRYFYWNPVTDEISWLSPSHPRASISLSAEKMKEMSEGAERKRTAASPTNSGDEQEDDTEAKLAKIREKRVVKKSRFSRNTDKDELDPMDPASYGECGRGTWSAGLDIRATAKTGVDSTASGPLFQQRPYPSPGAVLRANQQVQDT